MNINKTNRANHQIASYPVNNLGWATCVTTWKRSLPFIKIICW